MTISKKLLIVTSVAMPFIASAQNNNIGGPIVDTLNFAGGVLQVLSWMVPAAAVLVFFWLVIRFIWNKSRGEKAEAKDMLWGLVALVALFGVYGIIKLMGSVIGINPENNTTIQAPQLPGQGQGKN